MIKSLIQGFNQIFFVILRNRPH